jgi:hypothetical protein
LNGAEHRHSKAKDAEVDIFPGGVGGGVTAGLTDALGGSVGIPAGEVGYIPPTLGGSETLAAGAIKGISGATACGMLASKGMT